MKKMHILRQKKIRQKGIRFGLPGADGFHKSGKGEEYVCMGPADGKTYPLISPIKRRKKECGI